MSIGRSATITGDARAHGCGSSRTKAVYSLGRYRMRGRHLISRSRVLTGWRLADVHCRRTDAGHPDDGSDDPPGHEDAAELPRWPLYRTKPGFGSPRPAVKAPAPDGTAIRPTSSPIVKTPSIVLRIHHDPSATLVPNRRNPVGASLHDVGRACFCPCRKTWQGTACTNDEMRLVRNGSRYRLLLSQARPKEKCFWKLASNSLGQRCSAPVPKDPRVLPDGGSFRRSGPIGGGVAARGQQRGQAPGLQ